MTADEIRATEARWKSDVDSKLDRLIKFMELMTTREQTLTKSVDDLTEVLSAGRGSLSALYLFARVSGALGVIAAAIYAIKEWIAIK